jgi:hypothetical protein
MVGKFNLDSEIKRHCFATNRLSFRWMQETPMGKNSELVESARIRSQYMKKGHKSCELRIPFDPAQQDLYRLQVKRKRQIPGCTIPLYHHLSGRGRQGEFPFMVAREYFRRLGYKVLFSSSGRPPETSENFICTSYPGLRREEPPHPAYQRMARIFGLERLIEFNKVAERAKLQRKHNGNKGGGDPDLFVYKGDGRRVRFFVEVKHNDKMNVNQEVVFPLIEKHLECPVKLVRIYPHRSSTGVS